MNDSDPDADETYGGIDDEESEIEDDYEREERIHDEAENEESDEDDDDERSRRSSEDGEPEEVKRPYRDDLTYAHCLEELRGQSMVLGDLYLYFEEYPSGTSFWVEPNICRRVNMWIKLHCMNPAQAEYRVLLALDYQFELLAGAMWPYTANEDRLDVATSLLFWLQLWNDEMNLETGSYYLDFEGAQKFREESLKSVKNYLGLEDSGQEKPTKKGIIKMFKHIGNNLQEAYTIDQRERVFDRFQTLVEIVEAEQSIRLARPKDHETNSDEFLQHRFHISPVPVWLTLAEYCDEDLKVDNEWIDSEEADEMVEWITRIICYTNNTLCLKKDIELKTAERFMIMLYTEQGGVHGAIENACENMLNEVYQLKCAFEDSAARLLKRFGDDPMTDLAMLERYVESYRYMISGSHRWCFECPRYGIHSAWGTFKEWVQVQFGDRKVIADFDREKFVAATEKIRGSKYWHERYREPVVPWDWEGVD